MFCSKCGAQNADGAGFCSSCGSPLQQAQEEQKACAADTKSELPDAAQPGAAAPGTLSADCKYAGQAFTVTGRLK